MKASTWVYLWDIQDEGIEHALDAIQAMGADSLSIATSYHAGRFVHPHNPRRKIYFPEDGTIYFQPDSSLYKRIKPRVNSLVKSSDPLPKVAKESQKRGLGMVSWTVLLHNSVFGEMYPDCSLQNAFGDRYITSLCPASPDAREYVVALCKNISSLGYFDTLELESFEYMDFAHGYHHEKIGLEIPPLEHALLGLCFCSHCAKLAHSAGVDFQRVHRFALSALQCLFDGQTKLINGDWRKVLFSELNGEFEKFIDFRKQVVCSLVEEICESVKSSGIKVRPMVWLMPSMLDFYGIDLQRLSTCCDEINILDYSTDLVDFEKLLDGFQQAVPSFELVIGLCAIHPATREILIEQIKLCKKRGLKRFSIYNYGLLTTPTLTWVQEALTS